MYNQTMAYRGSSAHHTIVELTTPRIMVNIKMTQIDDILCFPNMREFLSEWITLDVVVQFLTAVQCNKTIGVRIDKLFSIISITKGFFTPEKTNRCDELIQHEKRNFIMPLENRSIIQLIQRNIKINNLNVNIMYDRDIDLFFSLDVSQVRVFRFYCLSSARESESECDVLRLMNDMANLTVLHFYFDNSYVLMKSAIENMQIRIWRNLLVFGGNADQCTLSCVADHCRRLQKLCLRRPSVERIEQCVYCEHLLQSMSTIAATNKSLSILLLNSIPLTEGLLKLIWTKFGRLVIFSAYQCYHSLSLGVVLQFCPSGIIEVVIQYVYDFRLDTVEVDRQRARYQNINWDLNKRTLILNVCSFDDFSFVSCCSNLPSTVNVLILDRLSVT